MLTEPVSGTDNIILRHVRTAVRAACKLLCATQLFQQECIVVCIGCLLRGDATGPTEATQVLPDELVVTLEAPLGPTITSWYFLTPSWPGVGVTTVGSTLSDVWLHASRFIEEVTNDTSSLVGSQSHIRHQSLGNLDTLGSTRSGCTTEGVSALVIYTRGPSGVTTGILTTASGDIILVLTNEEAEVHTQRLSDTTK